MTDRRMPQRSRLAWDRAIVGRSTAVIALLLTALAGTARADDKDLSAEDLRSLGLASEPVAVESIGLELYPPANASSRLEPIGDLMSLVLIDRSTPPTWSMRVQPMASTLENPSPAAQIDQLLASWRSSGRAFTVLSNEAVTYGGVSGRFCSLRTDGEADRTIIVGWLVLPFERDFNYLVFTFQTTAEAYRQLEPVLKASFSTMRLRGVDAIVGERRARLAAGDAFLRSVTPDKLKSLAGRTKVLRFYRPGVGGGTQSDVEVGFAAIEFSEAKRGHLNPARDEKVFTPNEHEVGLMVKVYGRQIENADRGLYREMAMRFWLAWDQSEEYWSVRVTRRQGRASRSEAETGARTPPSPSEPRGSMTVIRTALSGETREPLVWPGGPPEVYLSQAMRWGLSWLLPTDSDEPMELSYYCFDSGSGRLLLRRDDWRPSPDGRSRWILMSKVKSDAPEVVSIHTDSGDLIRRTYSDGVIAEPSTLEEIRRLWRLKGLETGPIGDER
jgi:hypothetical protein